MGAEETGEPSSARVKGESCYNTIASKNTSHNTDAIGSFKYYHLITIVTSHLRGIIISYWNLHARNTYNNQTVNSFEPYDNVSNTLYMDRG